MMISPTFLSQLEMTWLKKPDFFPTRNSALKRHNSICIGTKSRNLGDALILTPLTIALKRKYPAMRIFCFPRAFNPVVFYANPDVERVGYFPDQVFGDDCNWDRGHLIHQKQQFFDVPISSPARPRLFLTPDEIDWANDFVSKSFGKEKPICVVHCSGMTWKSVASSDLWETFLHQWKDHFTFVQVGVRGDPSLLGVKTYFIEKKFWNARKLFAFMSKATAFVGIDSGPMHVASAFSIPSLILIQGANPREVFERRRDFPYFQAQNWRYANLYEENAHIRVDGVSRTEILNQVDEFFHSVTKL